MHAPEIRRLLLAAVALLCLVLVDRSDAQCTTTGDAAQRLYATNALDSSLFGDYSEDASFFSNTRGKPNVYFLVDNSSSMTRLPPNGPSFYAGTYAGWVASKKVGSTWTFGSLPPLQDISNCDSHAVNGVSGDAADPGCVYTGLDSALDTDVSFATGSAWENAWNTADMTKNAAVMGCGDDIISKKFVIAPSATMPYGSVLYWLRSLKYQAPCDDYVVPNDGLAYDHSQDYADLAKACPRYDGTAKGATGSKGYDPDYYCGTGTTCSHASTDCSGTCCSSSCTVPNLFDKDRIFHDNIADTPPAAIGNGWTGAAVNPWSSASGNDVTTFCNAMYSSGINQGTDTKRQICTDCLNTRGFLLDGRLARTRQENLDVDGANGSHFAMPYPSIWFKGNFLNFYPPKFVIARRVLKDLLRKQSNVRVGIRTFDSGSINPYPTCANIDTSFNPKDAISFVNKLTWSAGTPTPSTMLAIGQSFHTNGNPWFGGGTSGDFSSDPAVCYDCQQNSLIIMTDGLPTPTQTAQAGNTLLTDTDKLAGDTTTGIASIDIPTYLGLTTDETAEYGTLNTAKKAVVQTAWYLHNMDLRKDTECGIDNQQDSSKQVLDVYTVGFATSQLPQAGTMLQMTARAGGGTYTNADSPKDLISALNTVMSRVASRATTFSVASISTLQSTTGSAVIVPRFSPITTPTANQPSFYPGHLFRFDLYSEFTSGCQVNADGTVTGDLDCDDACDSVFLVDKDGSFVGEDVTGQYFKLSSKSARCNAAKHCASPKCSELTTAIAKPFWDSSVALQHPLPTGDDAPPTGTPERAWIERPVYTVVDDSGDGKIDAKDTVFLLRPDDATANKLLPYLNLGGSSTLCSQLSTQIKAFDATEGAAVGNSKLECAKTIIRYVLGADVFNTRGYLPTGGAGQRYPVADQDTLADRVDKLGDIFHSSPVMIDPPLPPGGILCPRGLHNQCLASLWKTPTQHVSASGNAYADYADHYANRSKIVLVGANDGLLHAFGGGTWHADEDNPDLVSLGIHTKYAPYFGYFDRGDGSELWSFLSPDMLAKVGQLLLTSVPHPAFADGTPMVRDVWVDGSTNGMATAAISADDQKQAREFHTVAVIGERRGGNHFFALDVTDATYGVEDTAHHAPPKFLWIYPQPDSTESLDFGETYAEFLPTPPPIGPVRIKADAAMTATPKVGSTFYHEKWVVFLNGGFDPAYQRGRGVHMVNVWTGTEVFDFSKPAGATFADTADPRTFLDYPVSTPVGMLMWGDKPFRTELTVNDYFFDTATFGDAGGQLWVLRFSAPGIIDGDTHLVNNWFGARVFQMGATSTSTGLSGDTDISKGLPFFYITANVALGDNGAFRVLAGTGDRYNLLDTYGGTCKVDNIRACLQAGCQLNSASASTATLTAAAGGLGSASHTTQVTTKNGTPTRSSTSSTSVTGCDVTGGVNLSISACPTTTFGTGNTAVSLAASMSCSGSGADYGCTPFTTKHPNPLAFATNQTNPRALHNWYYSLLVFESAGKRAIFSTLDEAKDYDATRLYLVDGATVATSTATTDLALIDGSAAPSSLSSSTKPGYAIMLTHSADVTFSPKTYTVNQFDERTSSPTAVVSQCAFWNTTQRSIKETETGGTGCNVASPKLSYCSSANRNINYFYGADAATGGLCGIKDTSGTVVRSAVSATLVPPPAPQLTAFVNSKGQVQFGLTSVQSESGAQNIGQGGVSDAASLLEFLNVDRSMHTCRHDGTCK